MFKNWKRIAEEATARVEVLEGRVRADEDANGRLRSTLNLRNKERDALEASVKNLERECDGHSAKCDELHRRVGDYRNYYEIEKTERQKLEKRLEQIIECETPSANATVRRMARIARGES